MQVTDLLEPIYTTETDTDTVLTGSIEQTRIVDKVALFSADSGSIIFVEVSDTFRAYYKTTQRSPQVPLSSSFQQYHLGSPNPSPTKTDPNTSP
jgi:hypothetical protein